MFGWLKRLIAGSKAAPITAGAPSTAGGPHAVRRVPDVVDAFLTQNPQRTPFSVHALIVAGAADLADSDAVLQACDQIAKHGYQNPLNPTLRRELTKQELLPYLRWQAAAGIDREQYRDENTIRELIRRFRSENGN